MLKLCKLELKPSSVLIGAIVLTMFLMSTSTRAVSTMEITAPDFLVTDVSYQDFQLVIEVQNQGPAQHQGAIEIEVLLKQGKATTAKLHTTVGQGRWPVFGTQRSAPLDISQLLTLDPALGYVNFTVDVTVDPRQSIKDARPQNNSYIKPFSMAGEDTNEAPKIRGDYRMNKVLPDLVIEELIFDPPSVKARYVNRGGEASGADFRIRWYANGRERGSALGYRFPVPPSGQSCQTGGLSLNLLGLISGQQNEVKAVIDFEDRVRESREDNNSRSQVLQLGPKSRGDDAMPKANAEGTVIIGSQTTMPVVCSYLVTDAKQGRTLYLLPFVPQDQDLTDMRLGQIGQIMIRRRAAGLATGEQVAYLWLKLKTADVPHGLGIVRPRSVRVGVNGPQRIHVVDMKTEGGFTLGPYAKSDGILPWSIQGHWPAGNDNVVFHCQGKAQVYLK